MGRCARERRGAGFGGVAGLGDFFKAGRICAGAGWVAEGVSSPEKKSDRNLGQYWGRYGANAVDRIRGGGGRIRAVLGEWGLFWGD